ncbi:hypothetical protein [Sulfurovum sp.]|jgi:hypothetical protein|uniref:hypothetical protein n=1 Tax=Sulfurovum sp. TaxID=1969726 RepID=UPI002A358F20|nr:hypothetical protein [Sulfurovum sp.]MDD2451106.1 hypothetical protein [Sulfurovum sp.]MDD3499677.1 hypothetical protein [Sulfurovum sp.]MDY0403670.1 hypothetical protein [Sulfurovum sp.]
MNPSLPNDPAFAEVLSIINEMIEETVYHTETFAHALQIHRNPKAAEVFLQAVEQFETERKILDRYAQGIVLSSNPPWESPHAVYTHPAHVLMDAHYLISEEEAWKVIEKIVQIHQRVYLQFNKERGNESVISLTTELITHCDQCGKV